MPESATTPKPFCFVLMPFSDEFDDVYQIGIKAVCDEAGAYSERVDEQIFHESILDRLYDQIAKADFIVADMTGRNENVFYEVGYAHALGKRTILLTQKADDIPFDLKHYPHVIYGGKVTDLHKLLEPRVKWCVENPASSAVAEKVEIDIFFGSRNLSSGHEILPCSPAGRDFRTELTINNAGARTLTARDYGIGLVMHSRWCSLNSPPNRGFESTTLPRD